MSKATEALVEEIVYAGEKLRERGMVLVPREPSEDMLVKMAKVIMASEETDTFEEVSGRIYTAMIAEGGKQ